MLAPTPSRMRSSIRSSSGDGKSSGVPDQGLTTPYNLGAGVNDAWRFVGQVYTAGITGELTSISISLQPRPGAVPARVALRRVEGGSPTGVILAQATLMTGGSGIGDAIVFSETVPQFAGQQYAITVDYPTAPPHGPDADQGLWTGVAADSYPGGSAVESDDGAAWIVHELFDLHFRTYVAPCGGATSSP